MTTDPPDGWAEATPAALDLIIDVARIDPHVLRALDFSLRAVDTAGQTNLPAVLSASDSIKILSEAGSPVGSEGFIQRLKGYVGEFRVAGMMEGTAFPSTPNYPSVDLFMPDGTSIQIKTSLNEQYLRAALAEDPRRIVLIPEEMRHLTTQFENARSLQGFSARELEELTRRNVKTLLNLPSAGDVGLYVAVVSLGISAARYAWDGIVGRRSWEDAGLRMAIEGSGRATGAGAGATAGFVVGELLAPLTLGLSLPVGIIAGSLVGATAGSSFMMGLLGIESEADALLRAVKGNARLIKIRLEGRWQGVIDTLGQTTLEIAPKLREAMIDRANERAKLDMQDWVRLAAKLGESEREQILKRVTVWFLAHPDLAYAVPDLRPTWERHQAMLEAAAVAQNHPLEKVRIGAVRALGGMVEGGLNAVGKILPEGASLFLKNAGATAAAAYGTAHQAVSGVSNTTGRQVQGWADAGANTVKSYLESLLGTEDKAGSGPVQES